METVPIIVHYSTINISNNNNNNLYSCMAIGNYAYIICLHGDIDQRNNRYTFIIRNNIMQNP